MKKIFWAIIALVSMATAVSCDDAETYAEQKDKERAAISRFIKDSSITVISEAQFKEQGYKTDVSKNEFVLLQGSSVYMQIVREGAGEKIKDGETTTVLCRFSERKTLRNDRLEKIILSAAKQSLTPYLPRLNPLTDFEAFIANNTQEQRFIAHCYKNDKRELRDEIQRGKSVCVLIGPEGDFSEEEVQHALAKGFLPVGLGKSRLRTETAGVVACHTAILINA